MADGTKIEWTEATWSPITGCSVLSPGCTNCYAMRLAGGRMKHHPSRIGLTSESKAGPVWTGKVRFNEAWLDQPLRWTRPRMIFVCAHGDLFHENVPDEWIDRVFAVMALAPQHTYQVLTKRSDRMRDYMARLYPDFFDCTQHASKRLPLPLPSLWLGVSVEDQARADERIPDLLETPAALRWISAEPLLGPVNLWSDANYPLLGGGTGSAFDWGNGVRWVVAGGESGPGARPMHPAWAQSLRDQCAAAGVPYFLKQWGEWRPWAPGDGAVEIAHVSAKDGRRFRNPSGVGETGGPRADTVAMSRVGKRRAGAHLDGREHREWPVVAHV